MNVGVVAGTPYTSKYTNIAVTGHVEVNGMAYVGGVGGKNAYANWTNIIVNADDTSYVKADSAEDGTEYRTYVGGVIGFMGEGGHGLTNVSCNIDVIGSVCDVGGITGIAHYGNKFVNVTYSGTVTNTNSDPENAVETGLLAGVWHNQKGQTVSFTDCSSTGTINIPNAPVNLANGGLIGPAYNQANNSSDTSGMLNLDGKEAWSIAVFVDNVPYASGSEAAAHIKDGSTVVLAKDITMDKTYFGAKPGETLTLDLNGYTLTRTWQDWSGEDTTTKSVIYNQGTLTIKDSSASKTGKIQGYSDTSGNAGWNQEFKGAAISNASGATLNLEGGTVTRGDDNSFGYYTVYNKGTFNMSGGKIVNDSCASAMVCNVAGGSKFVMTGGSLIQESFQTLKNETGSTVHISGGTLASRDRTLQNYGTAFISGGEFYGPIQIPASGALSMTNGAIYHVEGNERGPVFGDGVGAISGGTFDEKVDEKFWADGYEVVQSGEGWKASPIKVVPPATGDSGNVLLYGMFMLVSLAGIIGTSVICKRKNYN